jgi:hypothetical protein
MRCAKNSTDKQTSWSPVEKLILADLGTPDPEIDTIWRDEANRSFKALYSLDSVSHPRGALIVIHKSSRSGKSTVIPAGMPESSAMDGNLAAAQAFD